jgi:hypothetical protein
MGNSRWSNDDWASVSNMRATRSVAENFSARSAAPAFVPTEIKVRESRDSDANPNSTPLILALDVTGSMGRVANEIAKSGLGKIFTEVLDRMPIPDPHMMAMAIGDVRFDRSPVQATQFEADIKISDQIEQLYVEGGGGGNHTESYDAAWYFAARKTDTDAWNKRQKKGYLFTLGDEEVPLGLTSQHVLQYFGDHIQTDLSAEQLLRMAEERYEVFHLIIAEGSHARSVPDKVRASWTELMGQRAIWVSDYTKLAEIIVSTIQLNEGDDIDRVIGSWTGDTSLVVANAVRDLATKTASSGLTTL